MNIKNVLPKLAAILTVIVIMASCEEDFNDIGANIIGDQPINSQLYTSPVVAYSRKLAPVQTNNLPQYQLGVYNDPVFGKTTASILSQVLQNSPGTDFGDEPIIENVMLYIPYNSTELVGAEESTFKLDSIFGSGPIKLNVFESNYFLRDFDPASDSQQQIYYSDQGPLFERNLGARLDSLDLNIAPDASVIVLDEDEDNEIRLAPGIRIPLRTEFFKNKIIAQEGKPELSNNNNFKDYFRGIYLKPESVGDNGFLALLDINKATVTINYTNLATLPDNTIERVDKKYILSFAGNTVNVFDKTTPATINDRITNPNIAIGEEKLYSTNGIISIINLFGKDIDNNGVAEELEDLRIKKWLITEANLIFYVDQATVEAGKKEPERIIIFDPINNTILSDYSLDPTSINTPIDAITSHLGRLQRGSDGQGEFYKIRITDHVSNLINNGRKNVPLAVMVSQNVTEPGFNLLRNNVPPGVKRVPLNTTLSPEGTVLFGNNTTNESKKLKLQIFYTEPK